MRLMKMVMVILMTILFGSLFISLPSYAEIYKWVDEKGTVHFTEDPSTIPERYIDKTKVRESPVPSKEKGSSTNRNPQYTYPQQRQPSVLNEIIEDPQGCGPGEYETNVFMMRYMGEKGKRSADVVSRCVKILKKCCHYNPGEFAELVDKYAKDSKWNVIPWRIPGLLSTYCGQRDPAEDTDQNQIDEKRRKRRKQEEEEVRRKKEEEDRNPRTGEFLPRSGSGVINPRTGEYYPPSGPNGYINPRTGEFYPKFGQGAITP